MNISPNIKDGTVWSTNTVWQQPLRKTGTETTQPNPSRTKSSNVNPEILAEFSPIIAGMAVFLAALAAKTAYVMLQFGPMQQIPASFGIASLAGVIAYTVFRHGDLPELVTRGRHRFRLLATSGATSVVFAVLFVLMSLLGVLSRYGGDFLAMWVATSFAFVNCSLAVLNLYGRLLHAQGRMVRRVAVYGTGEFGERVTQTLLKLEPNTAVVGVFDDKEQPAGTQGPAAGIEQLIECALDGLCDRVVLALPMGDTARIEQIVDRLTEVPVAVQISSDGPYLPCKVSGFSARDSILLYDVQAPPLGPQGIIIKTIMDYAIASASCVVLAPLMALIAAAIKLDSRGPVFFVQPRGGYRHKTIDVIKFRSMHVTETTGPVVQAQRQDPRVTRVGRFLRKTSLDELPQLFNVLRGELSLVGPRPHALAHDLHYGKIVEQYANRHKIKPGITGWAQVNGYRSETRDPELMRKRVKHDLHYIDNWSPWLDVKILFLTIGILFWDRHAY